VAARFDRLAILPLADDEALPFLDALPEEERAASWRLVRRDGSLAGYLGVRGRAPDALYRFVAARRDVLGRLVPDGDAPRRYP
jgi:hypothetical protein